MLKLIRNILGTKTKSSSRHSEREAHAAMRSRAPKNNKIKSVPHQPAEKTKHRQPTKKTIKDKPATKKAQTHKPAVVVEHKKKAPQKPEKLTVFPELKDKTRFTDLKLHEDVLFGLQEMGFEYCTPIQAKSLPFLLDGRDTAGKAQTGTGKTAAFLAATFSKFLNEPIENRKPGTCRALIMAPTRELAMQIYKDAEQISLFTKMNNLVVFGGMDHRKQRDMLNKPIDILIGTPGRIIDYSTSRHLNLSETEVLVLDEADRMLDMGFIPDVRRIINKLPNKDRRQTLLYSATLEDKILRLADAWLKDPVEVESEGDKLVTELIEQNFYTVSLDEKFAALYWIIKNDNFERMLIFGNLKSKNFDVYRNLKRYGIDCDLLSGDVPQPKRVKILERFRSGEQKIVIATDVAARGIHVDDVSIVINYDLPERAEDYVHRVGRTGRAGKKGKSISFVCEYGAYSLGVIEELLEEPAKCVMPPDEMLEAPPRPAKSIHVANPQIQDRNRKRPNNSRRR
ncbi:MAG: DEAD/DEAH box helicase [Victivallales bacterium]|nr:DEAD/DEAH box helicase [Victivallales bacterium]